MNRAIKVLAMCVAAPLLWTIVFWKVAMYSAIWQSQFKPTEGVQVAIKDGRSLQGSLHQSWSGDWVLVQSDQSRWKFADEQVLSMAFRAPIAKSLTTLSPEKLMETWRSWLPVIAYSFASLLALLALIQHGRLRNKSTSIEAS